MLCWHGEEHGVRPDWLLVEVTELDGLLLNLVVGVHFDLDDLHIRMDVKLALDGVVGGKVDVPPGLADDLLRRKNVLTQK